MESNPIHAPQSIPLALSTRKKPFAITALGWIYIIVSVALIVLSAMQMTTRGEQASHLLFTSIFCIPFLLIGIGILKLKNLARILLLIFSVLCTVFSSYEIGAFVREGEFLLPPDMKKNGLLFLYLSHLILIFNSFVIYFLTQPKINDLFSPPKPGSAKARLR